MPFFPKYPVVDYYFGNEDFSVQFPDLVRYSSILDEVKNSGSFYQKYNIKEGDRPDHVSQELYGTPIYHWTFFYMNDNLRESGWPLRWETLLDKVVDIYPNTVLTTKDEIFDKFLVGESVTGLTSEKTATILKRDVNKGQIWVQGTKDFVANELISNGEQTITITAVSAEKDAVIYYTDGDGNHVDIDPTVGPGENITSVTYLDHYIARNEECKSIRVLKPGVIESVFNEFKRAMK